MVLTTSFGSKLALLMRTCAKQGFHFSMTEMIRTPQRQAQLWCTGRTMQEKNEKISELQSGNALFLASCLENVDEYKPDQPVVTNAIPGYSWHQWGEAADVVWMLNNQRCWSLAETQNGKNGYYLLSEEAKKIDLTTGLEWAQIRDAAHIQLRAQHTPGDLYTLQEIDAVMIKAFEPGKS